MILILLTVLNTIVFVPFFGLIYMFSRIGVDE